MRITILKSYNDSLILHEINNQKLINEIKKTSALNDTQKEAAMAAVLQFKELALHLEKQCIIPTLNTNEIASNIPLIGKPLVHLTNESSEKEVIKSLVQNILPIAGECKTSIKKEESTVEKIKRKLSFRKLPTSDAKAPSLIKSPSAPVIHPIKRTDSMTKLSPFQRTVSTSVLPNIEKSEVSKEAEIKQQEVSKDTEEVKVSIATLQRTMSEQILNVRQKVKNLGIDLDAKWVELKNLKDNLELAQDPKNLHQIIDFMIQRNTQIASKLLVARSNSLEEKYTEGMKDILYYRHGTIEEIKKYLDEQVGAVSSEINVLLKTRNELQVI